MKTTGVRPEEFAASTCPDSRAVSVAMPANLHLPASNRAGIGPLNRKKAPPPNPDEPPEREGPRARVGGDTGIEQASAPMYLAAFSRVALTGDRRVATRQPGSALNGPPSRPAKCDFLRGSHEK